MKSSHTGRPPHVPTDDTRNLVESLSGFGIPQDEIARLVGIAPKTLRLRYAEQIKLAIYGIPSTVQLPPKDSTSMQLRISALPARPSAKFRRKRRPSLQSARHEV